MNESDASAAFARVEQRLFIRSFSSTDSAGISSILSNLVFQSFRSCTVILRGGKKVWEDAMIGGRHVDVQRPLFAAGNVKFMSYF